MNSKTTEMLASAVNILKDPKRELPVEDVVLMVYNLGRIDSSIEEASIDREIAQQGCTI